MLLLYVCALLLIQVPPAAAYAGDSVSKASAGTWEGGPWREGFEYYVTAADHPTFFPKRCADVMLRRPAAAGSQQGSEPVRLGSFGILHPEVLKNFDMTEYPASVLEIDLEPLL